jgi:hypothetical protein
VRFELDGEHVIVDDMQMVSAPVTGEVYKPVHRPDPERLASSFASD